MNHLDFVSSLIKIGYIDPIQATFKFSELVADFNRREHEFDGLIESTIMLPTVPVQLATRTRIGTKFDYRLERLE